MANLPPFRTRRSEPSFYSESSFPNHDNDTQPIADPDDDVPVLTHVIAPPPVPTVAPTLTEAIIPAPDLDTLTEQIVASLQPELHRLVRQALEQALAPKRG